LGVVSLIHVLLVEDNLHFRAFLRRELSARFPSVAIEEAGDGKEAMEKADDFQPRLVLMDIGLPGENGLEVTRKIKEKYPDVAVIVLTSHDSPEYREAARRYGADHFFTKDDDLHDIFKVAESILGV
jgi:two-component system response regulator YesN